MGKRHKRLELRKVQQAETRSRNGPRKAAERRRRDSRMLELLRIHKPPYIPALRSWLSAKLGKPSAKITAEDVQKLLAAPRG
jgi:hypothetical protein